MKSTIRVAFRHLERRAFMEGEDSQKEIVVQSLATLLGLLRAQFLSYQTSHWQVGGVSSYGDHLLFERLYGTVTDQIDQLAEKMIGYMGASTVELAPSVEVIEAWSKKWSKIDCPHKRGLESEQDCQQVLKAAYTAIEKSGLMTLGLDDWIMAVANDHETNTYLLQQALDATPDATPDTV